MICLKISRGITLSLLIVTVYFIRLILKKNTKYLPLTKSTLEKKREKSQLLHFKVGNFKSKLAVSILMSKNRIHALLNN